MTEKKLTAEQITDLIEQEDACGVNTLLQTILCFQREKINFEIFGEFNEENEIGEITFRNEKGEKLDGL